MFAALLKKKKKKVCSRKERSINAKRRNVLQFCMTLPLQSPSWNKMMISISRNFISLRTPWLWFPFATHFVLDLVQIQTWDVQEMCWQLWTQYKITQNLRTMKSCFLCKTGLWNDWTESHNATTENTQQKCTWCVMWADEKQQALCSDKRLSKSNHHWQTSLSLIESRIDFLQMLVKAHDWWGGNHEDAVWWGLPRL